ncbi:glycoside hydrolase family 13 protein [Microbacterium sp. STN6]|uniref:glycoside hydrolase family 13 protein n=1 Tax=Microbacterium sp. STN6 TaxID=2995588 RepID=UPI003A598BF1
MESETDRTNNDSTAPWWTSAVVYQIYPRSFQDSDGDGMGDIGGIRRRLDYLAELGIDVLWISPMYMSPQHDNGYDISDYRRIDPVFGTLEEFDELLGEAHERGIRIVMDLVVNHTSSAHPWFVESRSSKDNPKRDWYWWRPPRQGMTGGEPGAEPTNWSSNFSESSWQYDEETGEYYLHLFARQQPDLNWENPDVRRAVYDMMIWWLDRGIDGFRMDVINFISKHTDLPDAPAEPGVVHPDGHAYYVDGPRIHEFIHEMNEQVFAGRGGAELLTVGEMPGVTPEAARKFTDPARHELDMVFQFEHVALDHGPNGKFDVLPLDLPKLKRSLARWQDALADVGWNSLYLDNHDQPRLVSRFGNDDEYRYESATLWATVLHLHRGTPYVYQGEEIGMTNMPFDSLDDFRDIESINYYNAATKQGKSRDEVLKGLRHFSRDNARTPVQWDDSAHAGFTTGEPWIEVNPNYRHLNVAADRAADQSVFRYYQGLIRLRHENQVVALGHFELLEPEHPQLYAFTRMRGDQRLLVVANVSNDPLTLWSLQTADADELEPWVSGGEVLMTNTQQGTDAGVLAPWEARIYAL